MSAQKRSAAIVTGGGRGIGRAITVRLARELAVVVVGRTESDLQQVCAEVTQDGGVALPCVGDVAEPATTAAAVALLGAQGWSLTHLVCNAGIGKSGASEDLATQDWLRVFEVNVHGCFHMVRACLAELLKVTHTQTLLDRNLPSEGAVPAMRGAITIISSLAGVRGVAFDAAYTASKHALVGYARALALEYRKRGLSVTALCPGFVESEMTTRTIRGVMRRQRLTESEARQRVASRSPAGRILPASELAQAVALLGKHEIAAALAMAERGGYPILGSTEFKSE